MRVLFVSSGNSSNKVNTVIFNQAEALKKNHSVDIDYFSIEGKGIVGYLKNVLPLWRYLKNNEYDVIHAHYSFSAFVSSLSCANPLVVSLMGSDVFSGIIFRILIRMFSHIFSWKCTIVKSIEMKEKLKLSRMLIIPNGVDLDRFKLMNKYNCQNKLGWDASKRHILFPADPNRPEKNYKLAERVYEQLDMDKIELHTLEGVPNEEMPIWYNASDVILLTSLWEGSPNVVKEAMACNRPIISTDIGDVRDVVGETEGCHIVNFELDDVFAKTIDVLDRKKEGTDGRKRIIELKMDSENISEKIYHIYQKMCLGDGNMWKIFN